MWRAAPARLLFSTTATKIVIPVNTSTGNLPVLFMIYAEAAAMPAHSTLLAITGKVAHAACSVHPEIMARIGTRSMRSEEHTYELQSLMRISYAVFCLKKKQKNIND